MKSFLFLQELSKLLIRLHKTLLSFTKIHEVSKEKCEIVFFILRNSDSFEQNRKTRKKRAEFYDQVLLSLTS